MPLAEESVGSADKADCQCQPCLKARNLPNSVRPGTIHSYTSQPRSGWQPRRTADEVRNGVNAATFGVELETDAPQFRLTDLPGRNYVPMRPFDATPEELAEWEAIRSAAEQWNIRNRAHQARQQRRFVEAGNLTAEEAVSVAAPLGLWHPKHDGSVTGPEFASQPATLAYWRSHRPALAGMMRALLHGGMRSHDGDRCGLHINIGTSTFGGNADHLFRFAELVCANPRWATRMAQRTHASVQSWARFSGPMTDSTSRRDWAEQIARRGYASQDRYCVLNAGNEGRIEFRLPRGTLRVDRFYAKLEWVAAMVEYTRDASNATNVAAFVGWVQRSTEYPELLAFLRERFEGRFADDTATVAS